MAMNGVEVRELRAKWKRNRIRGGARTDCDTNDHFQPAILQILMSDCRVTRNSVLFNNDTDTRVPTARELGNNCA